MEAEEGFSVVQEKKFKRFQPMKRLLKYRLNP
jgi:hypothetical protein